MEGSVEVDTGSLPTAQPSQVQDTTVDEGGEESQSDNQDIQQTGNEVKDKAKIEYTDKGTKLDQNPQSAVHQELANAKRQIANYEKVLGTPDLLIRFAKESGMTLTEAKAELKDQQDKLEEFTADKFQTAEDVAKALNAINSKFALSSKAYEDKVSRLEHEIRSLTDGRRLESVAANLNTDISETRGKYPELDPKSPSYDLGLEQEISQLYHELDFDEQAGVYRGKISLKNIADRIMRAAGKFREKGTQDAQTVIVDKTKGRVITSGKPSRDATESPDAGTTIASRISNMMRK